MSSKMKMTRGSDNVLLDIGFSEEQAAELEIRSYLFDVLRSAIRDCKHKQVEMADKLGVDQPKISKIVNGKIADFSIERIAGLLLKLGYDISIQAQPAPDGHKPRINIASPVQKKPRSSRGDQSLTA